jgi:mono/diheme cytochrome c family protein
MQTIWREFGDGICAIVPPFESGIRRVARWALLGSILVAGAAAQTAQAADADNGRRLAQERCSPCHVVAPHQRDEVADSPPFETIARKFEFNAARLAFSMLDPHPRMNVPLTRPEAEDIAAYVATLGR